MGRRATACVKGMQLCDVRAAARNISHGHTDRGAELLTSRTTSMHASCDKSIRWGRTPRSRKSPSDPRRRRRNAGVVTLVTTRVPTRMHASRTRTRSWWVRALYCVLWCQAQGRLHLFGCGEQRFRGGVQACCLVWRCSSYSPCQSVPLLAPTDPENCGASEEAQEGGLGVHG